LKKGSTIDLSPIAKSAAIKEVSKTLTQKLQE
jgi:hypothetical protein